MQEKQLPMPWERQPSELDDEWKAFQGYRDMIPPRRITRAGPYSWTSLNAWHHKHSWRERALAYDAHIEKVILQEREDFLKQSARDVAANHMAILKAARELCMKEIELWLEASEKSRAHGLLKISDLNKLIEIVIKNDRLIRGETTEKISTQDVDLSTLSLDELKSLRDIRKKINKGDTEE